MAAADGLREGISEFSGSDGFHNEAMAGARAHGLALGQRAPGIGMNNIIGTPNPNGSVA